MSSEREVEALSVNWWSGKATKERCPSNNSTTQGPIEDKRKAPLRRVSRSPIFTSFTGPRQRLTCDRDAL
ncbi:hypothetical protein E2C01_042033 [Portunus trituberculatus]|uniref:Uncharacterized protein n=1 Tax=Portunus trituberculatus TaxID=210409 RepID=A0A5B7FS99_PORTR|nr:hypothetical protein [Portunus trituberculatus]